ncbi:right-handed parallel beta-helix repeat-containing protein [Lentisalinibacter salinarum]|uniref:hypothetical protein n=1 Tax=Lentisalinibacter salinarum TaxID=2992239 RepID=UPI0038659D75
MLAALMVGPGTLFGATLPVGPLKLDEPGPTAVSYTVPINGALDPSASATVRYTATASAEWKDGPDPSFVSSDDSDLPRNDEFSGMLWDLTPGASYEIEVTVTGSDGSSEIFSAAFKTRELPLDVSGRDADVVFMSGSDFSEVQSALDSAEPGQIFEFRGLHLIAGLSISRSGTKDRPIVIRGDDRETAILGDRSGAALNVYGDHIVVENLTLRGSLSSRVLGAVRVRGTSSSPQTGFTLRNSIISGRRGVRLWEGPEGEMYAANIYNNYFEGKWTWEDIVALKTGGTAQGETGISSTWNDDGLKVTGQGHAIFNNTFAGFGDTIKVHRDTSVPNIGIVIEKNLILWGGDDAFELDDGYRNTLAYRNMALNTGTLGSRQPNTVTGGPTYFVRNVGVNQFLRPWKLNDGPTGVHIIHNTLVATINSLGDPRETIWTQFQSSVKRSDILNNLWVHTNPESPLFDGLIKFTAVTYGEEFESSQWDGSAWYPDGRFAWSNGNYDNLGEARNRVSNVGGYDGGSFESKGIALAAMPFLREDESSLGEDWTTRVSDFDPALSSESAAARGGIVLRGYGAGLDPARGAVQLDHASTEYGARIRVSQPVRPRAPTNLTAD